MKSLQHTTSLFLFWNIVFISSYQHLSGEANTKSSNHDEDTMAVLSPNIKLAVIYSALAERHKTNAALADLRPECNSSWTYRCRAVSFSSSYPTDLFAFSMSLFIISSYVSPLIPCFFSSSRLALVICVVVISSLFCLLTYNVCLNEMYVLAS